MTIAPELLRRIVEGALLAAGQPLSEDRLLSLIDEGERPEKAELKTVLEEIVANCSERGFELKQVASGWRFQVPEDLAPWVNRLWEEKPQKYSRAILETMAIIAYRQPITRGDIEEIRGVAVSSHIVKTLSERGWIKVVGQRDVPGKPSLYATTREFLDYFNLRTLDDLPTLAEIRDIDSLNQALDLGQQGGAETELADDIDGEVDSGEPTAEPAEVEAAGTEEGAETSVEQDSSEEAAPFGDELSEQESEGNMEGETVFNASEGEDTVEGESPEVDDSGAVSEASLSAELPPSGLFADGGDSETPAGEPDAEQAENNVEIAETEIPGSENTDEETREEPQAENTTL